MHHINRKWCSTLLTGYAVHIILFKMPNYEYGIFIVEKLKHTCSNKEENKRQVYLHNPKTAAYVWFLPSQVFSILVD